MKKSNENLFALLNLEGLPVAKMTTVSLAHEIDKRVRRVFKMCESDSDIVRKAADEAIKGYTETQRELFKAKTGNGDRALKEAMVPTGEKLANGVEVFRIVPRGATLEEIDTGNDNGDHAISIAAAKSYSNRLGIAKDQWRGKYNDGHMLINQSSCSVDASEVVPFAIP